MSEHSAENDAGRLPCIHDRVSAIYAPPGGRWACDTCGQPFIPAPAPATPPRPGTPQNPVNGRTHTCPTPGYAGHHTAVGVGAISPPYVCHGCSTWFVLPEEARVIPPAECACRVLAGEVEGNTADPHTCVIPPGRGAVS